MFTKRKLSRIILSIGIGLCVVVTLVLLWEWRQFQNRKASGTEHIIHLKSLIDGDGCDDFRQLTVEATLGAVFMRGYEYGPYNLRRRANPGAVPYLRRMLEDKTLERWHQDVWMMLGFVGDATDVEEIERTLIVWRDVDRSVTSAMLEALGVLKRRGIPGTDRVCDMVLSLDHWEIGEPENARDRRHARPKFMLWCALLSYGSAGNEDIAAKYEQVIPQLVEPGKKPMISLESLMGSAAVRSKEERACASEADRNNAARKFNGNLEAPGPSHEVLGSRQRNVQ